PFLNPSWHSALAAGTRLMPHLKQWRIDTPLLGTDGGLHNTTTGGNYWTYVGGGHNGYNALQVYEVRGQWLDNISRHDLYLGTQDNGLWSSSDTGKTWDHNNFGGDVYFIEGEYHVATSSDSQITFNDPGNCLNCKSGSLLLSGVVNWSNPPGNVCCSPKIVEKSFYVQGIEASSTIECTVPCTIPFFAKGLAVTSDLGASWQQYAKFQ